MQTAKLLEGLRSLRVSCWIMATKPTFSLLSLVLLTTSPFQQMLLYIPVIVEAGRFFDMKNNLPLGFTLPFTFSHQPSLAMSNEDEACQVCHDPHAPSSGAHHVGYMNTISYLSPQHSPFHTLKSWPMFSIPFTSFTSRLKLLIN